MLLSETEEMLVIVAAAFIIMAIVGNTIKDYRRMSREAKEKVAKRKKDEAYVIALKEAVDKKTEELQQHIKEQNKS